MTVGRRVEGIDALRGIAVLLVLARHAWPAPLPGSGMVGVVMFFALSGYLITGVLHAELRDRGRVDLGRFYRRRAARLVPALLVTVVAVVAVTLLFDPLHDRGELLRTVLVALTWTADLPFHHGSAATFHLWTLATEEQFYLLWPGLFVAAFLRGRVRAALLVAGAGCLIACAATTYWLRAAPDLAYTLPTSWALCFVIGAAARVHADSGRAGRPARGLLVAVSLLLAVACVVPWRGHVFTYLVGGPVIAACTVVLLLAAREQVVLRRSTSTGGGPALLVMTRALVALGTVSYAAYLFNYPLTLWLRAANLPVPALTGPLAIASTLVLAGLSRRFVEEPVLRRVRGAPPGVRSGAAR